MGFYSLHAYDADVYIPGFLGLKQQDVLLNPDTRFAAEAENVETINGVLQPSSIASVHHGDPYEGGIIGTICLLHRRWFTGSGTKNWFVAATDGKLLCTPADRLSWTDPIPMPIGINAFQSDTWSWVTYEINPEGSENTVDVLLISNKEDGMFMVIPPDTENLWGSTSNQSWTYQKAMTWQQVKSPAWSIQRVDTRADPEDEDSEMLKFGVIERYAERIWGGDIAGHPDMLVYSRPYDPTDWTPDTDIPEDGAGEINVPTWDGDSFTALKRFGDQLLAFKENGIWRILGTNPGEFEVREQFGGGTINPRTIATYGERVFFVERDGVSVYDGQTTAPYMRENIEKIWRTVNINAMDKMRSAIFKDKYYLALPVNNSKVANAFLVYDLLEGTVLYQSAYNIIMYVNDIISFDDALYGVCRYSFGTIIKMHYNSWETVLGGRYDAKWVSPWMDLGRKDIQKGGFDLYFTPEVKENPVKFKISIQTEKKIKTKEYTVQPVVGGNKEHREKKLHFGGTGRKFRVIIETYNGGFWRIVGGIHLVVEIDPD